MVRTTVVIALIAQALQASAADGEWVRLGTVGLQYDPAQWIVERDEAGYVTRIVSVPERDVEVSVETVSAQDSRCDPASERERLDRALELRDENYAAISVAASGLQVYGVIADLGCRNWASHPVAACVSHDLGLHRFTYRTDGCQSGPNGEKRVIDLLTGLRPAN